jgi:predicted ATPase/DNA-binding CsgD family transcriptional regulator
MPLPAQVTSLVGREREIEEARVTVLGGAARLLTFTGPAGIGKTRLALAVAASLPDHIAHGARFVNLAALRDPALLDVTIATAIGLQEMGERPPIARLTSYLRDREIVLVLDNFEQILPAAPLVGELLAACPALVVLVTSRAPLHLYGEHEFSVPPLTLPPRTDAREDGDGPEVRPPPGLGGSTAAPQRLLDYAAVRLFVQRAQAVTRDFALSDENLAAVAELCVRLDGLPLAIELAAAHTKILSPSAMLDRLPAGAAHTSPLASGGAQDRPARHQTLGAAIGWSHDLLAEDERAVFRRLSVFNGGFDIDAAGAVVEAALTPGPSPSIGRGAGGEGRSILDLLSALVDKSLVQAHRTESGETRFSMFETIRSFALEQAQAGGELDDAAGRHAAYFTTLAQRAALTGPRQAEWLAQLDQERDNIREALRWAAERRDVELVCRLVNALWWFWSRRGYLGEGRRWLEAALSLTEPVAGTPPPSESARAAPSTRRWRARTLNCAGAVAWYQGDHAAAQCRLAEGLTLCQEFGDRGGVAQSLLFLGLVHLRRGEFVDARRRFEESVAIQRLLDDRWGTAMSLTALAGVPLAEGKLDEVRTLETESAALFRSVGDRWSLTMPLYGLSMAAYYQGDYPTARSYLEEVLAIRREVGDTWSTASTLHSLGQVARAAGERARALSLFQESLTTPRSLGNRFAVAQCLAAVAGIAAEFGRMERAARLLGAAATLFEDSAGRMHPIDHARYEADRSAVREALGAAAFERALAAGRDLPLSQAVQEALDVRAEPAARAGTAPTGATSATDGAVLTRREREVAALVARGLTNRQIAGTLHITEGTAGSHVEHILAKLGFQSRAQVAAWAVAQGLV